MIDLKEVITKYPECLESFEKLRAYLTDLYPNEKARVSIIVAIFNCGIADEIKNSTTVDEITIKRYCDKLKNDFGFSRKLADECLNFWLEVYEKIADDISSISIIKGMGEQDTLPNKINTQDEQPLVSRRKITVDATIYNNNMYPYPSKVKPISIVKNDGKISPQNMISAGYKYSIALKSDGTVLSTGSNRYGECDVNCWTDIIAVSAGLMHTIGLKSDGTVVATGSNIDGQCNISDWKNIVAISANSSHSLGLKSDGTVVATGSNYKHQCEVTDWTDIVAISAGNNHSLGLKSDGTVVAVGCNEYGLCDVSNWKDIVAISAGDYYSLGLKFDGTVVAVGKNDKRCGVDSWKNIVAINTNGAYVFGLKSDGAIVVSDGDHSVGTIVIAGIEEKIYMDEGKYYNPKHAQNWNDIIAISSNSFNVIGLKSNGTVVAIGSNENKQCDTQEWCLFNNLDTIKDEFQMAKFEREQLLKKQLEIARLEHERLHKEQLEIEKRKKAHLEQQQIWRDSNLCQNCGGILKGIFSKKCSVCGKKKDY